MTAAASFHVVRAFPSPMFSFLIAAILWLATIALWWWTRRLKLSRRRSAWLGGAVLAGNAAGLWLAMLVAGGEGPGGLQWDLLAIVAAWFAAMAALGIGVSFFAEAIVGRRLPFWVAPLG